MEPTLRSVAADHWVNQLMQAARNAFRLYHRHEVSGLSHLTDAFASGRPAILIGNHCLDVVDPLMLTVAI